MEPLFYNANMNGWWGAKIVDPPEWEVKDREAHPKARLVRWSEDRHKRADAMRDMTKLFTQAGITHMIHLLTGTKAGQTLRLKTYRDITRDLHHTPPFSQATYDSLVMAIPAAWKAVVGEAADLIKHGIKCVEVDTVIDSKRHDLLDDQVYERHLKSSER